MSTYGLSGQLWPIHLKPKPGESLTSWILRLAWAYRDNFRRFVRHFSPRGDLVDLDFDRSPPPEALAILARKTRVSRDRIRAMILSAYEGRLPAAPRFGSSSEDGPSPYPFGFIPRSRGFQVCLECLQAAPYLRLEWRSAFTFACLEHRVYLAASCPTCSAVIRPTAAPQSLTHDPLSTCTMCTATWWSSPEPSVSHDLIRLQARLRSTLRAEDACVRGENIPVLAYFEALRVVIPRLWSSRPRDRRSIGSRPPFVLAGRIRSGLRQFETLPASDRAHLLQAALPLLPGQCGPRQLDPSERRSVAGP